MATLTANHWLFLRGLWRSAWAIVGGYLVTAQAVSTSGAVLSKLGQAPHEAVVLASMLGFPLYLLLLLWGFAMPSLQRLPWVFVALGAALLLLRQVIGGPA